MSDIIEFLEQVGQTANLRYATGSELARVLDASRIDPTACGVLLTGDSTQLETLLGVRPNVCCALAGPAPV
jgi:hypothetical protein